ncbi:MAG: hypothetical protein NTV54_09095 [Ignavibacteriales bacterium]|nr:hypothetical protein [Ignavibacteriales bacterium]
MLLTIAAITMLIAGNPLYAQESEPYFYKGRDFGSEAMFNPIFLILNGGFDMIQVDKSRDIWSLPIAAGGRHVLKNLADPFGPIHRYGWGNFMKDQVIPLGLSKKDGQWWPNYTLHLVGGGMEYTALSEWFQHYKYPSPRAWAIGTLAVQHMVNEATENGTYEGDNVDPIADIYLFDIGGAILFSFDNINEFFSKTMNLADWSLQPSLSLYDGHLHNNGEFFSVKWKFPFSDRWHLFYYFGTNGVGGLSYKWEDGSALSVGVGMAASKLIMLNKVTNKQTLDLVWNLGVFYDIDNSLMTSLSITKKTDYAVNLNIYPGVIRIGKFSPGVWIALNRDGTSIAGVCAAWSPVGIAYGRGR